ncbi:uncharacterized protein EV420DRAFT_1524789 [Desarmillaria tabescens]|uniref:Uncharacterized protein n=1 Tax=Armillaria tabescens TaxID=1929756 RepID=A0AA39TKL9_ARMTA|nr:uncharacterized protein EV420DRAFT_1524789 [Desarmillaria tabescens]KAK0462432.1 hypothetical protein EV420DRAFT_1524789 [Desarmillaria tabescens]
MTTELIEHQFLRGLALLAALYMSSAYHHANIFTAALPVLTVEQVSFIALSLLSSYALRLRIPENSIHPPPYT